MTPRFRRFAFRLIKDIEQGRGYDQHGGWTQYGISSKSHPKYGGLLRAGRLPIRTALEIYWTEYYASIPYIEAMPEGIAFAVFDRKVQGSAHLFIPWMLRFRNLFVSPPVSGERLTPSVCRALVDMPPQAVSLYREAMLRHDHAFAIPLAAKMGTGVESAKNRIERVARIMKELEDGRS